MAKFIKMGGQKNLAKIFSRMNDLKWRKKWSNLFLDTPLPYPLLVGERGWGQTLANILGTQDLRAWD